jgi:integrase
LWIPTIVHIEPTLISDIFSFSLEQRKNGLKETTITTEVTKLKTMAKHCNLNNPEEIKLKLTELPWKNATKKAFVAIYSNYAQYKNILWKAPIYKVEERIPFIPTETEIDQLIGACHSKIAPILQLLKETGIRIGEAFLLKWIDLDIERKTLRITPEKNSNPRILPVSDKLLNMLSTFDRTRETILPKQKKAIRNRFTEQRNKAAEKLANPRIKNITFHTLRHWKGTMEYHKTKDVIHVKQVLGHKNIECTMIYINIEQAIFLSDTDEWISKISHSIEEEQQLIDAGFQLVRAINETTAIYKKRK